MQSYWWVNHKQTMRQEIDGGFLWSPKTESNGARSQFYENMRSARQNDLVISFAGGTISYVGVVSECALSSPKPKEFGSLGLYWSNEGWLLPMHWIQLEQSIRPKKFIEDLKPFLPTKYSPIHPNTGNGNQKAYLAKIRPEVFGIIAKLSGLAEIKLEKLSINSPTSQVFTDSLEQSIEQNIQLDKSLSDTERKQSILARSGQGLFRGNVFRAESHCRLTGVTNPQLLIASHIKPWRFCSSSKERLDGHNGLLLTPTADRLFDRGFVSFSDSGEVLTSSLLEESDLYKLGILEHIKRNVGTFCTEQCEYLAYHRTKVFLSASC